MADINTVGRGPGIPCASKGSDHRAITFARHVSASPLRRVVLTNCFYSEKIHLGWLGVNILKSELLLAARRCKRDRKIVADAGLDRRPAGLGIKNDYSFCPVNGANVPMRKTLTGCGAFWSGNFISPTTCS